MGWPLWEGFARGSRGRAHLNILNVAEEALRRSAWSGKAFRKSSPEEQSRLVFGVAEILARLIAEDYRRARDLNLDLADLGTEQSRFRRRKNRRLDRARVLTAVGNLSDEEAALEWYRESFEIFERTGDESRSLEHGWFREARDRANTLRTRLKRDQ